MPKSYILGVYAVAHAFVDKLLVLDRRLLRLSDHGQLVLTRRVRGILGSAMN